MKHNHEFIMNREGGKKITVEIRGRTRNALPHLELKEPKLDPIV